MARGYVKPDKKENKFLKEAGALIELVNLVDIYRLGKTRFNECSRDYNTKCHKEIQRNRQVNRGRRTTSSQASCRSRIKIRNKKVSRHSKPIALSYKIKSQSSRIQIPKQIKNISQLKTRRSNPHKNGNTEVDTLYRSMSSHESAIKALYRSADSEITKCFLAKLATQNGGINLLKDLTGLIEHGDAGNTPTMPTSKNYKRSFKSSKNYQDSSDLHKESQNHSHSTEKRYNENISFSEYSQSTGKKPSLRLNLNLNLKPSSDVINIQIKTKKRTKSYSDQPEGGVRFLDPCDPSALQEQINKLLVNHLMSKLSSNYSVEFPQKSLIESANDHEIHFLNKKSKTPKTVIIPHTQAVYNMYDVNPLQIRKIHGIKSNLHLHMNFNNQPRPAQTITTDDASTITKSGKSSKPYKLSLKSEMSLNSGSGQTSLQQSFSVGGSDPRSDYPQTDLGSETCDCEPFESDISGSEPYDSSTLCETCCHEEEMARLRQQTPQSRSFFQNYSTLFRRTKQRITNRVAEVSSDPSLLVVAPCNFFKRIYQKCTNKVEQEQKNASICTCNPFVETQRVSVIERDGDPNCSVLKRLFGNIIFNDKCVVCAGKKVELKHHKFKRYECEPGSCTETKPLFSCLTKLCQKCKISKKNEEKKKKKTPLCKLLSLICEPEKKKEDKRRLLSKCCKYKKHGDTARGQSSVRKGFKTGARRHFRYATKRIRDRYYRNKKLAEEQKGQYACDFYLMSLRRKPCIWVYYMCPFCYPHCLQALSLWRQVSDILLFFVAILIWSPCIMVAECFRVMVCI